MTKETNMSEENEPGSVILDVGEVTSPLVRMDRGKLRAQLFRQGLRVVSDKAIVIYPGTSKETREGLHRALDVLVAMFIARQPLGQGLPSRTSVMELMTWSSKFARAEAADEGD